MRYIAILNQKGAYDRVPGDGLIKKALCGLEKSTVNMIATSLQPRIIKMAGDETNLTGLVTGGMRQGSPEIPCLFNQFMNGYAKLLKEGMT